MAVSKATRSDALSVSLAPRTSSNSNEHYNRVWSKPDLLLFPIDPGTIDATAGKTSLDHIRNAGPYSPDTFHRAEVSIARSKLISAEPNYFGWKLEATEVVLCFLWRKRRTWLPIEIYPSFSQHSRARGRICSELVLALVKRNFIYVRYIAEESMRFSIILAVHKANFEVRIYDFALEKMKLNQ